MEQVLSIFKNYFGIAFLFLIISYLSPKETYRRYFQFLISVLIAVILIWPVAEWIMKGNPVQKGRAWEEISEKMDSMNEKEEMEGDLFECFGLEESTESD